MHYFHLHAPQDDHEHEHDDDDDYDENSAWLPPSDGKRAPRPAGTFKSNLD